MSKTLKTNYSVMQINTGLLRSLWSGKAWPCTNISFAHALPHANAYRILLYTLVLCNMTVCGWGSNVTRDCKSAFPQSYWSYKIYCSSTKPS